MNIREYVDNPMGKGDSSIPNRRELIESLSFKYDKLISRKGNDIKLNAYHDRLTDDYFFHLVIPSETERSNSYDVVFKFSDTNKEHHQELSISKYDVTVFSNSPSFAYTFAYVYAKNGLFIESLGDRLGKEFFKKEPEVRNRFGIINYDKYVYFGARFILDSKRLNRAFLDMIVKPYHREPFSRSVRTLDTIMTEYGNAEAALKKKRNKLKQSSSGSSRSVGENKTVKPKTSSIKTLTKKTAKKPIKPKSNKVRKL